MVARFLLDSAVQDSLQCLAKEHSLNIRVVLVALSLAGYGLFSTLVNEWARPAAIQEATYGMSIEAPASPRSVASLPDVIAALPTVTPPEESAAPRAGYAAASLPVLAPLRAVTSLPTVTPPLEPQEPE